VNKYLAEVVGTFILVYAAASSATVYSKSGQLGVIGIGLVRAFPILQSAGHKVIAVQLPLHSLADDSYYKACN
jgi:glycerol uptake facilitator-like aquaporin